VVDKLPIKNNLADIDRGIESGVPKRTLYKELSEIAQKPGGGAVSREGFKKVMDGYADRIHGTGAEKSRG
jgi:hypothetical protein